MLVRVAAAKVIAQVTSSGISLNSCLQEFSQKVALNNQALLAELSYGTLRYYPAINRVLMTLMDKPLKQKDREITALLACALYQLTHTRIPSHAVVNESVAACKALKSPWAKGLVNALLRRFIREQAVIEQKLASEAEYASAHPQWLIDLIDEAWPENAAAIMATNNDRAPMTLRLNTNKVERDKYLQMHFPEVSAPESDPAPTGASATKFSLTGIQLTQPKHVAEIPGFDQGLVSVQDEAAQLATTLLDVQAGQRVLDACCAPGGKTCHILESAPDLRELVAIDIDAKRLEKVQENLTRLQLSATLIANDVADTNSWWDGEPFERILLDAPCSATGVIRRHPDIKLLRKPEDIAQLAKLQLSLLTTLWPLLKAGGKLLYATCSVLPQENDDVIAQFTATMDNIRLHPINIQAGTETGIEAGIVTTFGRQLFPQTGSHDGFYYAILEKI